MEKYPPPRGGSGEGKVTRAIAWMRALRYAGILFSVVTVNFLLIHLMPGDPLVHLLGEEAYGHLAAQDPAQLEALAAHYGLDGSLAAQYGAYLASLARGDLGWSFQYNQPVIQIILTHLRWTLLLLAPSLILSASAGGLLGLLTGLSSHRKYLDRALSSLLLALYSLPLYCLAFLLLLVFAFHGGIAPLAGIRAHASAGGVGLLRHIWLPAVTIILHASAYYYVIMSGAVQEVLREAFIFNARAKGFHRRYILFRHVLKNALLPFLTVVAMQSGALVGGSLLVEIVFSWQGVGSLIFEAVSSRDYPLLSGCFLIVSLGVIIANAAADGLYALIDPRIRDGGRSL
jgi:peptide/nickel transport system permease protein